MSENILNELYPVRAVLQVIKKKRSTFNNLLQGTNDNPGVIFPDVHQGPGLSSLYKASTILRIKLIFEIRERMGIGTEIIAKRLFPKADDTTNNIDAIADLALREAEMHISNYTPLYNRFTGKARKNKGPEELQPEKNIRLLIGHKLGGEIKMAYAWETKDVGGEISDLERAGYGLVVSLSLVSLGVDIVRGLVKWASKG